MKLVENGKTITRRDLVSRLEKVQRALGIQAQRANAAERETWNCARRSQRPDIPVLTLMSLALQSGGSIMPSRMTDAIAAHRAAWQAFQAAPEGKPAQRADDAEATAAFELTRTIPTSFSELTALKAHLDWFVVEEADRKDTGISQDLFALHAIINLATQGGNHV